MARDSQTSTASRKGAGKSSHSRSASHPLASLFGRKKTPGHSDNDSTDDDGRMSPISIPIPNGGSPLRKSTRGKKEEDDMVHGNCMTCGSKIRWPKEKSTFRCTECSMINDLIPIEGMGTKEVILLSSGERLKGNDLSIEKIQTIIDRCIIAYFKKRFGPQNGKKNGDPTLESIITQSSKIYHNPNSSNTQLPEKIPNFIFPPTHGLNVENSHLYHGLRRGSAGDTSYLARSSPPIGDNLSGVRGNKDRYTPLMPQRYPPPPPSIMNANDDRKVYESRASNLKDAPISIEEAFKRERYERIKAIFRPLEDFLMMTFGNHDCLNTSFLTGRPQVGARTRSEGTLSVSSSNAPAKTHDTRDPFFGLDAKTLLLGDFAENGSWWAGRIDRHRSSAKPRGATEGETRYVSSKSPRIHWAQLEKWYETLFNAGYNWDMKLQELILAGEIPPMEPSRIPIRDIEGEFDDAQLHLRRTLFKITETLLKRPGRPIQRPDDIRFLLMILSNPLLHPSHDYQSSGQYGSGRTRSQTRSHIRSQSESDQRLALRVPEGKESSRQRSPSVERFGHHSGILKRVLGIIANSPHECHRHLTLWFSRLNERQFRHLADIVGTFVTHRVQRQNRRPRTSSQTPAAGLVPHVAGPSVAQLHAALGLSGGSTPADNDKDRVAYADDWQLKAAAKVMTLLFTANNIYYMKNLQPVNVSPSIGGPSSSGLAAQQRAREHGQLLPISDFYNSYLDQTDLIADFELWESRRGKFSFCQYPLFLSLGAKIKILEYDAKRQMMNQARDAFFASILSSRNVEQHFHLRVRRECLVEDSLQQVSEAVGAGQENIKKGLRVHFVGEEGVDAGGLRKEWFLSLVREIFDPNHGLWIHLIKSIDSAVLTNLTGMFVYDDDSLYCYFNPNSFETSDQYFLVGVLLGLAIYNSTILDVALPPFAFKKLLAQGPMLGKDNPLPSTFRPWVQLTLDDLAEYRPQLAHGLRQLLEYEGDVESTYCRDFVIEVEKYGTTITVPLCEGGERRPVTNENRQEFVDLYVKYLLDTAVSRQFDPFKRGFFTVCGGNSLSLFRPEEIELAVRGSDEPLDIASVRAVAQYNHWNDENGRDIVDPAGTVPVLRWFWEFFEAANPTDQRKILSFITGSDRIPAVGATSLKITITCLGNDCERFPVARTCFNLLQLYRYGSRKKLVEKLWRAVVESEGFGLK
ncbi:hypothetical protein M501DRAFT_991196 [Patellaria atrata CBS 101060]|uniref:HECT-type E3 ubiquitin transferase n=1 Tax=Patellaria atrata CBS 101060 TaxID=1346257 RepID=A0A9P4VU19_9PEZI|nr:hypothetical protein M501DRAFT_991196 [Patellaria atrata CBS 101060]